MTLKEYKDYFKENFAWTDAISIGKIDNNQEKAICFYNSKRGSYVGTINNKTTNIKRVTILLRYTKNQNKAEIKANEVFKFYENRKFDINGKNIFVMMQCPEPISLGTDDNNVYEYSIELDFYEQI